MKQSSKNATFVSLGFLYREKHHWPHTNYISNFSSARFHVLLGVSLCPTLFKHNTLNVEPILHIHSFSVLVEWRKEKCVAIGCNISNKESQWWLSILIPQVISGKTQNNGKEEILYIWLTHQKAIIVLKVFRSDPVVC